MLGTGGSAEVLRGNILLVLMLCVVAAYGSFTQRGGHWCVCVDERLCQPAFLRFRPQDGTMWESSIQEKSGFFAIVGHPVRTVVIQLLKGAYGPSYTTTPPDLETPFDLTNSSATMNVFANSTSPDVTAVALESVTLLAGQWVIKNLVVTGPHGALGVLNFTTSTGLWITSPTFELYEMPAQPNVNPTVTLVLEPVFSFLSGRLSHSPVVVAAGKMLPLVIVRVADVAGGPLFTEDGSTIAASAQYVSQEGNITLSGASAQVGRSIASFSQLGIPSDIVPGVEFRITFGVAGRTELSLTSGVLAAEQVPLSASLIQFSSGLLSAITPQTQELTAALGTPLPPVVVEVQNSAFEFESTGTGLVITATAQGATLNAFDAVAPVRDGRAVFDKLVFTKLTSSESSVQQAIITFTAGEQEALPVAGKMIYSPLINVSITASRPIGLRFANKGSFLAYSGQTQPAVRGAVLPPIIVEVFSEDNSLYLVDGISVSATSVPAESLQGTVACKASNGRCVFDALWLHIDGSIDQTVSLIFASPVGTVKSGPITVSTKTARAISMRFEQFSTSLINDELQSNFATMFTSLPPIVIEILNSKHEVDTRENEIIVHAKTHVFATSTKGVAHNGRVVFPGITFGGSGTTAISFTAQSKSERLVAGTMLTTGHFAIEPTMQPSYVLQFNKNGFIQWPGHRVSVAGGIRLPPIGVQVVNSAHEVEMEVPNVLIRVSCTEPSALISGNQEMDIYEGTAWFRGITVSVSALPRLLFTAIYDNESAEAIGKIVVGKTLSSGDISFIPASDPLRMELLPVKVGPDSTATPITQQSEELLYIPSTKFAAAVAIYTSTNAPTLPPDFSTSAIVVSSSDPVANGTVHFQHTGQQVITSLNASFQELQIQSTTFLSGFTSVLTFSSAWPALKTRPLKVGPFLSNVLSTDLDEPVIVAEVEIAAPAFSVDNWVETLVSIMKIDHSRVEITRTRPGASSVDDYVLLWVGTRVEFKFLTPTTESEQKLSSSALAQLFLSLEADCNTNALRIRHKYLRTEDPSCDVYRIDEQLSAARRCVMVSSPDERCDCHMPLMRLFGERCKKLYQMELICSQLRRCTDSIITDACWDFEFGVWRKYGYIAMGTISGVAVAFLFYRWRKGHLAKNKKASRLGRKKKTDSSIRGGGLSLEFEDVFA